MIMYQTEHPDYGWITHPTVDAVLDELRNEIEANNLFPDELTLKVRMIEMSQEEFDALPDTDD